EACLYLFADAGEYLGVVAAVVDHDIGADAARLGQPASDREIQQGGVKREIARQRAARILGKLVALGDRDPRTAAGAIEEFEQIGTLDETDAAALELATQPCDAAEPVMDFG